MEGEIAREAETDDDEDAVATGLVEIEAGGEAEGETLAMGEADSVGLAEPLTITQETEL